MDSQEKINQEGIWFDSETINQIAKEKEAIYKFFNKSPHLESNVTEISSLVQKLKSNGIKNQEMLDDFLGQHYLSQLLQSVKKFVSQEESQNSAEMINLLVSCAKNNQAFSSGDSLLAKIFENLKNLFQLGIDQDDIERTIQDGIESITDQMDFYNKILKIIFAFRTNFNELEAWMNAGETVGVHLGERSWNPTLFAAGDFILKEPVIVRIVKKT